MGKPRRDVLIWATALALSAGGATYIQQYEDTKQVAYVDSAGVPTICTGSTKNVFLGQKATLAECEQRLVEDTTYAGESVQKYVQHKLSQQQYDVLVSFVFNVGETKFRRSTLLQRINAGDCYAAGDQFLRWVYAGKKKLKGLAKRRADERRRWLESCNAWA